MKRRLFATSILALALGGCGQGPGDGGGEDNAAFNDATTIEATGSPATIGANGPGKVPTPTFIENAAVSDMYEIQAANIALAKSKSDGIRQFAQQMAAEHSTTSDKLKSLLPTAGVQVAPPTALDTRHAALIDTLQKTAPDKFDEVYLDQQTQAHREALGLMDSYATYGDNPVLKGFAGETKPKIQMHLDMAAKLDHGGADEGGAAGNSGG